MSAERNIRNCNTVVVGGCGFLGSHLVKHLIEDRGCNVLVIDNLISGKKEFLHKDAEFVWADITGSEYQLYKLLKSHKTRFVMNMAAEPYIPISFERPLHVFDINAMGALKVINSAQDAGCEGILTMSSGEIYGEGGRSPGEKIRETDQVFPHSTYGSAKAAIDNLIQVRWKEAKTPCIALRQFNCIGENDHVHPYICPELIRQIHNASGLDVEVKLGNNSFRDFLYAGDAMKMATELLEKGQFGEVYNSGSQTGITMYELAKLIGEIMGKRVSVVQDPTRVRPWEIWELLASCEKLYSIIDYRPQVSLQEALRIMVVDFHSNGSKWGWE